MKRIIKKLSLHHSGGLGANDYASTQHLTWGHINNAHQARWGFKSSLGYYGGYQFFIDQWGVLTQFRAIGEEGAHTVGANFDGIGICLAGNFIKGVDKPTEAQVETLGWLLVNLYTNNLAAYSVIPGTIIEIKAENIKPHREWQLHHTQCNCLPSEFGRQLLFQRLYANNPILKNLISLFVSLKIITQPLPKIELGDEFGRDCPGFINNQ